jgi:argininosuccinate lyase
MHRPEDTSVLTFGLWGFSMIEGFLDDLELLKSTYEYLGRAPLHKAMHNYFEKQYRLYCQTLGLSAVDNAYHEIDTSRGKSEAAALFALVEIAIDLQKLSSDLSFFNVPNYGCVSFEFSKSSEQSSESRSLDTLDLIQAKSSLVEQSFTRILRSNKTNSIRYPYLRIEILQPAISGVQHTLSSLKLCNSVLSDIKINEQICSLNAAGRKKVSDQQAAEKEKLCFEGVLMRLDGYQDWSRQQRMQWTNLCNRLLGRVS